jgi:hypothetical protein
MSTTFLAPNTSIDAFVINDEEKVYLTSNLSRAPIIKYNVAEDNGPHTPLTMCTKVRKQHIRSEKLTLAVGGQCTAAPGALSERHATNTLRIDTDSHDLGSHKFASRTTSTCLSNG